MREYSLPAQRYLSLGSANAVPPLPAEYIPQQQCDQILSLAIHYSQV